MNWQVQQQGARRPSHRGWHRPDLLSLFFGLVFFVLGTTAALSGSSLSSLGLWGMRSLLIPGLVIVVGVLVLARVAVGLMTSGSPHSVVAQPPSAIPEPTRPVATRASVAEEDRRWLADEALTQAEREVLDALQAAEQADERDTADPGSPDADEPDRDQGQHDTSPL